MLAVFDSLDLSIGLALGFLHEFPEELLRGLLLLDLLLGGVDLLCD